MSDTANAPEFQESRIEDEPILGTVLRMPDGRIQQLTWFEKLLVALHLASAKTLEGRYAKLAAS
jgi:hypothetical protein